MKIAIVNKSDRGGGAHRAAYRLHTGLREIGVDSKMLVDNKRTDDPEVYGLEGKISKAWGMARAFANRIPLKFYDWQKTPFYITWIGRDIATHELLKQTDIIHLHWIAGGFLSIRGVSKLAELGKPIVWTLHDMWAFTGGCHYSGECERYIDSCGSCPQLGSNKDNDITRKIWGKKKAYRNLNLTIVTPSRWLAECAKSSSLFSGLDIKVIPYGLDTNTFSPVDKLTARNTLSLPENKKIILFGAAGELESRKGFNHLKQAIGELDRMKAFDKEKERCLVIFGAFPHESIKEFLFESKFLGRLDDSSLRLSYSAADVFVGPSLQEAFGLTHLEAMACGTPCVAFNYSGPQDIIDHKENGYLAEYKNSQSLAEGIKWVLEDENRALKLGKAAREKAVREYSLEIQAKRYKDLYNTLVK